MKSKYLYIKNFKNIKEVEIDFTKRVNLIIGDTGSGKSSIIDSIKFILTDTLDEKLAEYIRKGTEEFNIHYIFEHQGIEYDYDVKVNKSTKKTLIVNGEEFYNSDATKKLAEVIDPVITRFSAISEQGKTSEILFQKASERLKTLKDILKVDMLTEITDEMKEEINVYKEKITNLNVEKTTLESRSYTYQDVPEEINVDELKAELDRLNILEVSYNNRQEEIKKYNLEKSEYDQAQNEINNYIKEKNTIDESIKDCESKILKVSEFNNEAYEEASSKYRDALIKNEKIKNDISNNDNVDIRILAYTNEIESLRTIIDGIKLSRLAACEYTTEDLDKVTGELNENTYKRQDLKNKLDLVKNGKCPTCGQEFNTDITELEKEYNNVLENVINLTSKKTLIKNTFDDYNAKIEEQRVLRDDKKSKVDKVDFLLKEIEKIESTKVIIEPFDMESIEQNYRKLEEEKKLNEKTVKDNKVYEDQLTSLKNKIEITKFKIEEKLKVVEPKILENIEIDYNREEHNKVKESLIVADQVNKNRVSVLEFNNKLREDENKDKVRVSKIEDEIDSIKKEQSILDDTKDIIDKEFSSFLISKGAESIRYNMNKFFQKAYDKYTVTMEQDKNSINFFYSVDGNSMSPCGMASGHEKSVLGVANRYALCKLNDLGLFIADEIDSFSSEEKSMSLINGIIDEDIFENIFIISHQEETKEMISLREDADVFEIKDGELVQ